MGNCIKYVYKCPNCDSEVERNYKALTHINCDFCKTPFDSEKHWISSRCNFTGAKTDDKKAYWIGGIQFHEDMKFDVKIEAIARRYKPLFIEHGHGYAVMIYDLAHTASMCHNLLMAHDGICEREDWKCEKSGDKIAIINKKWKPPTEKEKDVDGNKNESYAG